MRKLADDAAAGALANSEAVRDLVRDSGYSVAHASAAVIVVVAMTPNDGDGDNLLVASECSRITNYADAVAVIRTANALHEDNREMVDEIMEFTTDLTTPKPM